MISNDHDTAKPKAETQEDRERRAWASLSGAQTGTEDWRDAATPQRRPKDDGKCHGDGAHQKLCNALKAAKEKLELYRSQHSGAYIGGVEYTALIRQIDDALKGT